MSGFFKIKIVGKEISIVLFFSVLSIVAGTVKFYIPGVEGGVSDFREIPLLISLLYITNPLYTIIIGAITALATPADGSYFSTFVMHAIGMFIGWYVFAYLKRATVKRGLLAVYTFAFIVIYYVIIMIPLLIVTNYIFGLNTDKHYFQFYLNLISSVRFEMLSTGLIVSLYVVQYKLNNSLKKYSEELEDIVQERTEELKSTIKNLKDTQQYLIQSEKMNSLGTLSAGVAHEINNPLNFIAGGLYMFPDIITELESKGCSEEAKKIEEVTGIIDEGFNRTLNVVNSLMSFSYSNNSKKTGVDINRLIDSTLSFLSYRIPDRVVIKKEYHISKKVDVYTDKIHQVIVNIIENAIFEIQNNRNGIGFLEINTYSKVDTDIIKICNNGGEISEKYINLVFDPFFTTKETGEGIGLGLSIAYALVKEHGGELTVSNMNGGVCFCINLPH